MRLRHASIMAAVHIACVIARMGADDVNRSNKISKRAKRLLDEYAHDVSDHREWNNEHNVKRSRAALVAYILKLESRRKPKVRE